MPNSFYTWDNRYYCKNISVQLCSLRCYFPCPGRVGWIINHLGFRMSWPQESVHSCRWLTILHIPVCDNKFLKLPWKFLHLLPAFLASLCVSGQHVYWQVFSHFSDQLRVSEISHQLLMEWTPSALPLSILKAQSSASIPSLEKADLEQHIPVGVYLE